MTRSDTDVVGCGTLTRTQKRELQRFAGVNLRQIQRWEASVNAGQSLIRAPGSGRPSVVTDAVERELVRIAQETDWTGTNEFYSLALSASGYSVSSSSVQRLMARDGWKTGTASSVPFLKPQNCNQRVLFCTEMQQVDSSVVVLHTDEKVFMATAVATQRAPPDVKLAKLPKSNASKTKIMVLAVTGEPRPEFDFGGKLMMHLIGELHASVRSSKHHSAGDVYTSSIGVTVDAKSYFRIIVDVVKPAIRKQFAAANTVILQMDNAPAHVGGGNYADLEAAMNKSGAKPYIRVAFQPPNSPDLNLNDLGVFFSIQQSYRVVRVRSKLKASKRIARVPQIVSVDDVRSVRAVVRDARRCSHAGRSDSDESVSYMQTPSPTPAAVEAAGCSRYHKNESDEDMPCIRCRRAGNAPAENGDGSWVCCDARGGWWHTYCVNEFDSSTPLPKGPASAFVCALCRVGSNAVLFDDSDIVDGQDAWSSVYDVDVPVRYGLDSTEALWGCVRIAWEAMQSSTLSKLSKTLRIVYERVITHRGSNDYELRETLARAHSASDI